MLASSLLRYRCLLNEKRLSGITLSCSGHCLPSVTGFSPAASGRTAGLKNRVRLPAREAPRNSPGAAWKARFSLI